MNGKSNDILGIPVYLLGKNKNNKMDGDTSDQAGGGGHEKPTPAEEMLREYGWKITGRSSNLDQNQIQLIDEDMRKELDRMKDLLKWKMVTGYIGVNFQMKIGNIIIPKALVKTDDTQIETVLQTDISQIQKGKVFFKYNKTNSYYLLTDANNNAYRLTKKGQSVYDEALQILSNVVGPMGVMTTGLLAAAGAWQLNKLRKRLS